MEPVSTRVHDPLAHPLTMHQTRKISPTLQAFERDEAPIEDAEWGELWGYGPDFAGRHRYTESERGEEILRRQGVKPTYDDAILFAPFSRLANRSLAFMGDIGGIGADFGDLARVLRPNRSLSDWWKLRRQIIKESESGNGLSNDVLKKVAEKLHEPMAPRGRNVWRDIAEEGLEDMYRPSGGLHILPDLNPDKRGTSNVYSLGSNTFGYYFKDHDKFGVTAAGALRGADNVANTWRHERGHRLSDEVIGTKKRSRKVPQFLLDDESIDVVEDVGITPQDILDEVLPIDKNRRTLLDHLRKDPGTQVIENWRRDGLIEDDLYKELRRKRVGRYDAGDVRREIPSHIAESDTLAFTAARTAAEILADMKNKGKVGKKDVEDLMHLAKNKNPKSNPDLWSFYQGELQKGNPNTEWIMRPVGSLSPPPEFFDIP